MDTPDDQPSFGARFLAALRTELGATVFDYAIAQQIKSMDHGDIVRALRERAGADYATIQRAKQCDDPEELARMFADGVRAAQQAQTQSMVLSSVAGLLGLMG